MLWRQHTAGQSRYGFSVLDCLGGGVGLSSPLVSCRCPWLYVRSLRVPVYSGLGELPLLERWATYCRSGGLVSQAHDVAYFQILGWVLPLGQTVNKNVRCSLDHLLKKWLVNFWQSSQRLSNAIGWSESCESGKAVNSFPMRKCPGDSTSNASAGFRQRREIYSRLELRHASTCASVVVNSSRRWVLLRPPLSSDASWNFLQPPPIIHRNGGRVQEWNSIVCLDCYSGPTVPNLAPIF